MFTGNTSSGESQIRRWLLENDYLEAIVAMPTDMFYNTGIATYIWILSKNKSADRKGKVQLIDASNIYTDLRKPLGNKRRRFAPQDREKIVQLYANFAENDLSQIHDNTDFIYREYTVMQPLQRSYGITIDRIENMLQNQTIKNLYDETKVQELEAADKLTAKEQKKLDKYKKNKPMYDEMLEILNDNISDKLYMSPEEFRPVIIDLLGDTVEKRLISKIVDGLSKMDKNAEIQKDKKGNVKYDKDTSDTEIVNIKTNINDYMKKEVLPFVPDAKAFFEEDVSKKKPVIKTGAEIPFTRYFYKYQKPESTDKLKDEITELEKSISVGMHELFE